MLIKLTEIRYSTVGSRKLDKKIVKTVCINTDLIATMRQTAPSTIKGVEGEVLTEIYWGAGRFGERICVSETIDEILTKSRSQR